MRLRHLGTALLLAACGGEAVVDVVASGGGGGNTTTGTSGTTSNSTSTTTTGTGAGTGSGTGSGTSSSSSSSGSGGCPGCTPGMYCDYADNHCGMGGPGDCKPMPQGCPDMWLPSCGCDGFVYGNPCEASSMGVDISNDEICAPPLDMFACGSTFCFFGSDYCVVQISDVGGWPDEYFCAPLPPQCMGPGAGCGCLANVPCGELCEQDTDGSLTVICPGG